VPELELKGSRFWLGNSEVILAAIEYHLLRFLWDNKGDLVFKDAILNEIWNGVGGDHLIQSNMQRLRKKLPLDTIQTRYGLGYILD